VGEKDEVELGGGWCMEVVKGGTRRRVLLVPSIRRSSGGTAATASLGGASR